jgi:hypothetical protein
MNTSKAIEVLTDYSDENWTDAGEFQHAVKHAIKVMNEHKALQQVAQRMFQQNSYMRSRLHDRCISVDGPVMMQVEWRVGNEH